MKAGINPKDKMVALFVDNPIDYPFSWDMAGDCAEVNCDGEDCGSYSRCQGCNCIPESKKREN